MIEHYETLLFMLSYDEDPGHQDEKLRNEIDELHEWTKVSKISHFRSLIKIAEREMKEIKEQIAKLSELEPGDAMTLALDMMSPSTQAAPSWQVRERAKTAFDTSVEKVESVVDDACILHSLLIAEGSKEYNVSGVRKESMAKLLHVVSQALFHAANKVPILQPSATIAKGALNENRTLCDGHTTLPCSGISTMES